MVVFLRQFNKAFPDVSNRKILVKLQINWISLTSWMSLFTLMLYIIIRISKTRLGRPDCQSWTRWILRIQMLSKAPTFQVAASRFQMINGLFWNAQGISKRGTIYYLKSIFSKYNISFCAILEPKVQGNKIILTARKLGFSDYMLGNHTKTHKCIFWKGTISVSLLDISS